MNNGKQKAQTPEALALIAMFDDILAKDKTPPRPLSRCRAQPKIHQPTIHRYEKLAISPAYRATHRTVLIVRQHCISCGESTDYVAGDLTCFEHKRLGTKRMVAYHNPQLPLKTELTFQEIPQCPTCLALEILIDDTLQQPPKIQRDLWESVHQESVHQEQHQETLPEETLPCS